MPLGGELAHGLSYGCHNFWGINILNIAPDGRPALGKSGGYDRYKFLDELPNVNCTYLQSKKCRSQRAGQGSVPLKYGN